MYTPAIAPSFHTEVGMAALSLTPEQEAQAQQLFARLQQATLDDLLQMCRLLASKPDAQLLGRTEFQLRDLAHSLAAKTLQAALDGRKKGGTKAPA